MFNVCLRVNVCESARVCVSLRVLCQRQRLRACSCACLRACLRARVSVS